MVRAHETFPGLALAGSPEWDSACSYWLSSRAQIRFAQMPTYISAQLRNETYKIFKTL